MTDSTEKPKQPKKPRVKSSDRRAAIEAKKAADAATPKRGRPQVFDWDAVKEEIAERLANGENVTQICASSPHLPNRGSIFRRAQEDPEFFLSLSRARELWTLAVLDDCQAIAADSANDWEEKRGFGGAKELRLNREAVERSKLKINVLQFNAIRFNPRMLAEHNLRAENMQVDVVEQIKADQTVIAPDEKGPDKPVL